MFSVSGGSWRCGLNARRNGRNLARSVSKIGAGLRSTPRAKPGSTREGHIGPTRSGRSSDARTVGTQAPIRGGVSCTTVSDLTCDAWCRAHFHGPGKPFQMGRSPELGNPADNMQFEACTSGRHRDMLAAIEVGRFRAKSVPEGGAAQCRLARQTL